MTGPRRSPHSDFRDSRSPPFCRGFPYSIVSIRFVSQRRGTSYLAACLEGTSFFSPENYPPLAFSLSARWKADGQIECAQPDSCIEGTKVFFLLRA